MAKRAYLTPRQKIAVMRAQGWFCACSEACRQAVWPGGPVEYDHRPPFALGGPAKPNQAVVPHHHRELTKVDVRMIRKADRQRKAHRGEKHAKQPFPKKPEGFKHRWPTRRFGQ